MSSVATVPASRYNKVSYITGGVLVIFTSWPSRVLSFT